MNALENGIGQGRVILENPQRVVQGAGFVVRETLPHFQRGHLFKTHDDFAVTEGAVEKFPEVGHLFPNRRRVDLELNGVLIQLEALADLGKDVDEGAGIGVHGCALLPRPFETAVVVVAWGGQRRI